jgi:hypothetical protein
MTSNDKPFDETDWRCCWRKQSYDNILYCPDIAWRQLRRSVGLPGNLLKGSKKKMIMLGTFPDIVWRPLSWKVGLSGNVLKGSSRKKMCGTFPGIAWRKLSWTSDSSDRIAGQALGTEPRTSLKWRSIAKSDIRIFRPYLSACCFATPLYGDDVVSTFGFYWSNIGEVEKKFLLKQNILLLTAQRCSPPPRSSPVPLCNSDLSKWVGLPEPISFLKVLLHAAWLWVPELRSVRQVCSENLISLTKLRDRFCFYATRWADLVLLY